MMTIAELASAKIRAEFDEFPGKLRRADMV
jgi:hypothetical protein